MKNKEMKEENKRSKYWNELVEVLEQEFPKGECKERGGALVLLSYAEMALQKQKTELEKAAREEILEEYTNWLCKHNYTDADVYAEEPRAVDRFLEEKYLK